MKRITDADIEAARTPNGGWTRAQLAEWGVPWPPPKGWMRALLAENEAEEPEWLKQMQRDADDRILRYVDLDSGRVERAEAGFRAEWGRWTHHKRGSLTGCH